MLVDSHCHLDFDSFEADRADVLARARAAGVGAMVTICTKVSEFARVRAIAETNDDVWCSVGIHPHEADAEPAVDVTRLAELARHPKVVGIGETGLDYYYEHGSPEGQARSFAVHIEAAQETGLPLIVHTRDADDDTRRLLARAQARRPFTGVLHCFTSGRALAEAAVEMGFFVSFSGILTFKSAAELRETARALPLDRLLVETDSPYLAPVPHRGRRNEPAFVERTAALLAEVKGVPAETLARATTDNFYRLFAKAVRPAARAA